MADDAVLVVPPETDALRASRIVIAWKDTVEARRAVSGALGFIRHADQVYVASVGDGSGAEGAEEVAAYLARHGYAVAGGFRGAMARQSELRVDALPRGAVFYPGEPVFSVSGPSEMTVCG